MIFKQAQQVLDGRKRQTRRPVKPGETTLLDAAGIAAVYSASGRIKWVRGFSYAVQPGRGKESIGRTPPIKAIRRERLQEISLEDIEAEGITTAEEFAALWGEAITHSWLEVAYERLKKGDLRNAFRYMWRSLYKKPHRWEDDPDVWVLVW